MRGDVPVGGSGLCTARELCSVLPGGTGLLISVHMCVTCACLPEPISTCFCSGARVSSVSAPFLEVPDPEHQCVGELHLGSL